MTKAGNAQSKTVLQEAFIKFSPSKCVRWMADWQFLRQIDSVK